MSSKIAPPYFINEASEYPEYKTNLLRWSRITKTPKVQMAECVLYQMKDHSSGIAKKIDTALGDEVIDKEDGLDKLVEYLDSIYKEDDMALMWSKYKKFTRLRKTDEQQPITEFIAEFEAAYKDAKNNGCEVSDTVLALSLLDSCNLSEINEKFVLTDVDFKTGREQKTCLAQVKRSLRKFQSRDRLSEHDGFHVKEEEDAFIADMKSALLADGWKPPTGASGSSASSQRYNSDLYKGRKNKLGPDGNPMRCLRCNSEYHFANACDKAPMTEIPAETKVGSAQKQKKVSSSAKKKSKSSEKTMLSQLLQKRREHSMMCDVHEVQSSVEVADISPTLRSLSSLFSEKRRSQCDLVQIHVVGCSEQQDKQVDSTLMVETLAQLLARESDLRSQDDSASTVVDAPDDSSQEDTAVTVVAECDVVDGEGMCHVTRCDHLYTLSDLLTGEITRDNDVLDLTKAEMVLVSQQEDELCYLVEEAGTRGVIDTGCSKSVSGMGWVEKYTKTISPNFAQELQLKPSSKVYEFGGGERRPSKGCVTLPTLIGDLVVHITMDIVDASIPLLIGSNSLEAGHAVLDFQASEATFFGEVVSMVKVCTGHYCIDLHSEHLLTHIENVGERYEKVHDTLVSSTDLRIKDLKKLHHYYGHTSCDKLLNFLQKTGKDTTAFKKELLEIEKSCESCIRTKRRKPRPRSAIPRADAPNQILTIDLKEWETKGKKTYIIYMIDMFSRLTAGAFVNNKHPETVVNCLLEHWITHYGKMRAIHSDIGGEISNSTMQDVANKLGVELTTTASYSPHQNGVNERNHAVVDLMIVRMLASDKSLSPRVALMWALNAKNSLDNYHGFSSFQLHIGYNPELISAVRDGPPTLENTAKSRSFVSHVNAMMAAREGFIKAESSFSLKKALKSKIHPRGNDITEGDLIYYKKVEGKTKTPLWKGPSKVTSVNGKKLFIDSGSRVSTVNRDDAVRVGEEYWKIDDLQSQGDNAQKKKKKKRKYVGNQSQSVSNRPVTRQTTRKEIHVTSPVLPSDTTDSSSDEFVVEESANEELSEDDHGEAAVEDEDEDDVEEHNVAETEVLETENDEDSDTPTLDNADVSDGELSITHEENALNVEDGFVSGDSLVSGSSIGNNSDTEYKDAQADIVRYRGNEFAYMKVKLDDTVSYRIPETGVAEVAKVLSRAAKATGPKKHWWNVQVVGTGVQKSVNMEVLCDLSIVSDTVHTLVVAIPRYQHNQPECVEAKEKELKNWVDFGVYVEVEDVGQKAINTNWVLVQKPTGVKARLCIRGDQEPNKETIRTDSPTANKVNIKMFYIMAASHGWMVRTADVKAAFLQGVDLDREVFVRPPLERRKPGLLWKMVKRAYGFVDASRGFYLELEKTLIELGCTVSRFDPAMYLYFSSGELCGMLLTHVDDFLHGSGDNDFHMNVMLPLKKRFMFGDEAEYDFFYTGLHVRQEGRCILVDQDHYVDEMDVPDNASFARGVVDLNELLDDEGQSEFRTFVGRIGWIANSTRPDVAFDHMVLSMRLGKASYQDMKHVTRIMKKIKCEGTSMRFVNLGPIKEWSVQGYGDAGFKSLPDRISSCGGQVIVIMNSKLGLACVLDWRSKKIKRVVSSSTAAEALAANETLDEMVYVKAVLVELLGTQADNLPLVLFTDSKNLWDAVHSTSLVENHRLRTDIAKLQESLKNNELSEFVRLGGKKMMADVLTKKGAFGYSLMHVLHTCEL